MKKTPLIILIILVGYCALYIGVRQMNHGTILKIYKNASDDLATNSIDTVAIRLPASGFSRHTKQAVYGLFYPIGKIDKLLTGRLYGVEVGSGIAYGVPDSTGSNLFYIFKE